MLTAESGIPAKLRGLYYCTSALDVYKGKWSWTMRARLLVMGSTFATQYIVDIMDGDSSLVEKMS